MESGKALRLEELENGQQEMQEKISRATNMVTSLTKGKGITDGPSLQKEPISRGDGNDPFIVPNQNDCCEQEELRKIRLDGPTTLTRSKGAVS